MVETKQKAYTPVRLYDAEGHTDTADSQEVYDYLTSKGWMESRPGGPAGFQATWLYHKDGRAELVETEDVHHQLMEQGGWASSPAEHGVISAPSRDQMQLMGQSASGQLVSHEGVPAASSLETQVGTMSGELSGLFDTLHSQQQVLDMVLEQMKQVQRRLDALEEGPRSYAPPAPPEPPTTGRK